MTLSSIIFSKTIKTTTGTFPLFRNVFHNPSRITANKSYKLTNVRCFVTTLRCLTAKSNDLGPQKITEFHGFKCQDPIKGDLVYVGTLYKMVKRIKIFSLTTSIVALSLQPLILKKLVGSISLVTALTLMMNLLIFSTPIILHLITKRYVVNIYHDQPSNTFTATTYNLFLREKKLEFKPEDVTPPLKPLIFSNLIIKNKTPLFIDPSLFLSRDAYVTLMKYDQPLDWQMEKAEKKRKTENE